MKATTKTAAAALCVATLVAGCGGKSSPSATDKRYCELAKSFAAAGPKEIPSDGTHDQVIAALRTFVAKHSAELDEMTSVAPAAIKDDVAALAAAQRKSAEVGSFDPMDAAGDHEKSVHAYDKKHCGLDHGD